MVLEALRAYEIPGEKWTLDEVELLPRFLSELRERSLLLDLAGRYGRVSRVLLNHGHHVVLLDLSFHSLKVAVRGDTVLCFDFVEVDENPALRPWPRLSTSGAPRSSCYSISSMLARA